MRENCRAGPEDRRRPDPLGARVAQERGDPDSPQLRLFAVGAERLMHSPCKRETAKTVRGSKSLRHRHFNESRHRWHGEDWWMFDRLKAGLKQPRDKSCNEWLQKWSRRWAASSCFLKPPRMAAAMARVRPARTVTDKLFAYLSYQDARKALDWLSAIGFFSVIRSQLGDNDVVDHAEVRRGQAVVSTCSKE